MKHKLFTTLLAMLMSMAGVNAFADDYDISAENEDGVTLYYKYINNGEGLEVVRPWDCYDQETIRIPSEVQTGYWWETTPVISIEKGCFSACENLTSIYIPSSITNIGEKAFLECDKLESIEIEDGNEIYDSRDNCNAIIETNSNTLIVGCKNSTVPYGINKIGNCAFKECKGLTSIDLSGDYLREIGDSAFYNCTSLETAHFPYFFGSIGNSAFEGCKKLTIPMSPGWYAIMTESIGNYAFYGCEALTYQSFYADYVGAYSFAYTGIEEYYVYFGTKNIGAVDWGQWNSRDRITYTPVMGCKNLTKVRVGSDCPKYDSRDGFNGIIETSSGKLIFAMPAKYIKLPQGVKEIAMQAFVGGSGIEKSDSVDLGEGVETLASFAFHQFDVGKLKMPSTLKDVQYGLGNFCTIDTIEIADLKAWCENCYGIFDAYSSGAEIYLVYKGKKVTDLKIPQGTTKISKGVFRDFIDITSVTIPNSVEIIEERALPYYMTSVYVEKETPLVLADKICDVPGNVTLYVPRGSKAAYEAADYWKDFKEIKEYGDGNASFTMNSSNISTYSNVSDLDFTSVEGLKAYIASGFKPSTGELTMTRVYEVPAGEGLLLKGAAGDYEIPYTDTDMYYSNLLVGVPTATTVSPTDGSYTNFILANDAVKGIGFYPLASAGEIGPNKAYLQLPTSILPAASRSLRMVFEDEEEETTGINALNDKEKMMNDKAVYDLQGRRVVKPTRGLYIKDGKKIMVK